MKKATLILGVVLAFIGLSAAAQPKILEVTDNMGNSFDVSGAENGVTSAIAEEELAVSDDTEITLCVTEVSAENKNSLVYDFEALQTDGAGDVEATTDNCNTWSLEKSDYTAQISFRIRVGNQDDIEYSAFNRDYVVDYKLTNPVLPDETEESETFTYETVKISRSKYQELKNHNSQESETKVTEEQKIVDKENWSEVQQEVAEKNQRITELQERITELENRIQELNSRLNKSENSGSNMSESTEKESPSQTDGEGFSNGKEADSKPGFLDQVVRSIFG